MGRGAQTQTMQMTDQQLANQNAMNQALYNQGQSLSNTTNLCWLIPAIHRRSNRPSIINRWARSQAPLAH
jgi:hypothetical protein